MTETKPGLLAQIKSYPAAFWVANTMEIFERMSWYGWFTVMALYVTGTTATGGLGFSTETRGLLQAIVPFLLYLMPVLTGALADRYGFRKMFIIAYLAMIASYYLLGQFSSLPGFFLAFLFVAVAAAIFKPVVVGTVAKATDETNSATGFGIFYMMVNVGGFAGPIVAGSVRAMGWEWVFVACSGWALVNLIIVLLFYREPARSTGDVRTFAKVLEGLVEVLGNLRFFITVGVTLVGLMVGGALSSLHVSWFSWPMCGIVLTLWVAGNFVYDSLLPLGSGRPQKGDGPRRFPLFKRMHCSNWRFALFLLIMSGFWTSFNQIFYTMPEYIRDFTQTRPLIRFAETIFGASDPQDPNVGIGSRIATINEKERAVIVEKIESAVAAITGGSVTAELLEETSKELLDTKVRLQPSELEAIVIAGTIEAEGEVVRILDVLAAARKESTDRCMQGATMNEKSRDDEARLAACKEQWVDSNKDRLTKASEDLAGVDMHLTPSTVAEMVTNADSAQVALMTNQVMIKGRQVNPEFMVNINAGAIVLFQVLISFLMARFHRFTTIIVGMLIAAVGIGFSSIAGGEGMVGLGSVVWVVAGGIFIFSFGEMMASPTSQEYVGRIAPADKKALYMGYYFVAVALGNLFGGILSGQLYGSLARDLQRPDLMWLAFGLIMLATAIIFLLYNKFALPKEAAHTLTGNASDG